MVCVNSDIKLAFNAKNDFVKHKIKLSQLACFLSQYLTAFISVCDKCITVFL